MHDATERIMRSESCKDCEIMPTKTYTRPSQNLLTFISHQTPSLQELRLTNDTLIADTLQKGDLTPNPRVQHQNSPDYSQDLISDRLMALSSTLADRDWMDGVSSRHYVYIVEDRGGVVVRLVRLLRVGRCGINAMNLAVGWRDRKQG